MESEIGFGGVALELVVPLLANHGKLRMDDHQQYYHRAGGQPGLSQHHEPLVDGLANGNVQLFQVEATT
jgi:hypothetical protein